MLNNLLMRFHLLKFITAQNYLDLCIWASNYQKRWTLPKRSLWLVYFHCCFIISAITALLPNICSSHSFVFNILSKISQAVDTALKSKCDCKKLCSPHTDGLESPKVNVCLHFSYNWSWSWPDEIQDQINWCGSTDSGGINSVFSRVLRRLMDPPTSVEFTWYFVLF